ncbi:MAG: F0F1 ATP synthase subunit delta [Gammaproteobacteria bacterium]|nr:F0F1 ATP synthase subunit delta [Gammaproteobacteria bacterium]
MAEPITLARPYARAAFQAALAEGALADWSRMLGVAAAVAGAPAVRAALTDPGRAWRETAELFGGLCGEELSPAARNLVNLLAENKRLPLLPQIRALFDDLKAGQERSVEVEFVTAFPVGDDVAAKLEEALRARLQREIRLGTRVDPALIGGAVIRAGDQVIDSSIRGKLAKLAERLT